MGPQPMLADPVCSLTTPSTNAGPTFARRGVDVLLHAKLSRGPHWACVKIGGAQNGVLPFGSPNQGEVGTMGTEPHKPSPRLLIWVWVNILAWNVPR